MINEHFRKADTSVFICESVNDGFNLYITMKDGECIAYGTLDELVYNDNDTPRAYFSEDDFDQVTEKFYAGEFKSIQEVEKFCDGLDDDSDTMREFSVTAEVTTYCHVKVKARNAAEAVEKAREMDGGDFFSDSSGGSFDIREDLTVEVTNEKT